MAAKKTTEETKAPAKRGRPAKKAPAKKAPAKKAAPKKAAAKKTPRAKKAATKKAEEVKPVLEEVDEGPIALNLGDLFWEYRAKTSEWEKAYADHRFTEFRFSQEKSDPKYIKLLALLEEHDRSKEALKQYGLQLREVQAKAAKKLGISLQEFLKNCTVDHETGIVRFLD